LNLPASGFELEICQSLNWRAERALPAWLAAPTTAATIPTAAASAAATEIAAADGFRPRFIHHQRPSIELILMEVVDRFLRVFVRGHFDERKATRAPRGLVTHHAHVVDSSGPAEEFSEFFVRALIREVAHVQSAAHRCETLSRASLTGTVTCRRASDRTPGEPLATNGLRGLNGSETRNLRA
jgi:hypothetical protein